MKVASAEWKRSLRWIEGIQDWMGDHTNLHATGRNGLESLADRGLEEIQRVLDSDRYFRLTTKGLLPAVYSLSDLVWCATFVPVLQL